MSIKINSIENKNYFFLGIDIGSTTAKVVLIDNGNVIYDCYERHFSQVRQKSLELVKGLAEFMDGRPIKVAISGSAGLGMARAAGLPFVQEVFATGEAVKVMEPDTSVVIELGGEDAKVLFLKGGTEERMNGSCAGGTGAFIDQMATLMNVTNEEMDALSLEAERLYPIASRCGVFAKTDIQPLLNQGARKADIAASIYKAVVNQTIAGLAQGRRIGGKVMFLGGPLYYCKGLRKSFAETLNLSPENAVFPEYGRYAVAIGSAIYAAKQPEQFSFDELLSALEHSTQEKSETHTLPPLFASQEEYEAFCTRHASSRVPEIAISQYHGRAFLGIDCGSTTTKLVLISENAELLYSYYSSNKGNPVEIVLEQLKILREKCVPGIQITGSAVTGYGEELIKHAFHVDHGLVETMAHFTAARHFNPNVEFILDIGGQDIKCFKIRNNAIDSIMLNEACSSGCGSFIETFAKSMGYEIAEFSKLGLFAKAPVDLGSRCTVFMNSSVKQAQKDGAEVGDISAGLSVSVVKNALYKVIRANSADELGNEIVVQGGTFYNDAVLRSFELEIGHDVIRPMIAGLMGAFGAALHAKAHAAEISSLLTQQQLQNFTHTAKAATCHGCTNHCRLTINTFSGGEKYISGNKCEKGAGKSGGNSELPDLHEFKRNKFKEIMETPGRLATIGLPLALGMYEMAPFWQAIFSRLGFGVVLSGFSDKELYAKGQYSIPSDTACYPAKIMHGHIETLIERGVDAVFYPCLTYNFDEGISDNHYNCPVVAYYSELLYHNMDSLRETKFMFPYLNVNNARELALGLNRCLKDTLGISLPLQDIRQAVNAGYTAYDRWMRDIRDEGTRALNYAKAHGKTVMVIAGRPYHIDPEIGHGIDKLATALGFVVVSEDSLETPNEPVAVNVLNQWTYHARLYAAAQFAAQHKNVELVQLVSFGCGVDAITTDEVRAIMERHGRLYTQIKIDEITNLGAVTIRLRSLLGAISAGKEDHNDG
ncbi:MAG: acyl-CoA dehydratase activase-related protein [Oscillospiraceae bacterium]